MLFMPADPPAGIEAVACRSLCFATPGCWERPQEATQRPLVEQAKGVATLAESPAAGTTKNGVMGFSGVCVYQHARWQQ